MQSVSLPLPSSVSSTACVHLSDDGYGVDCDNLFLLLYRFVPDDPGTKEGNNQKKRAYLEALSKAWPKSPHQKALQALHRRRTSQFDAESQAGRSAATLTLETDSRLIAGLGYDNTLEVGMSLHPLHGFPYLPGSSVKGVARTWARDVLLAQGQVTEQDIRAVFGNRPGSDADDPQSGRVRFADALPVIEEDRDYTKEPALEVDVMTPHYGPYYMGEGTGKDVIHGDWHQPVPVPFLTVAPGVPFHFALTSRDDNLLQTALTWLQDALLHLGIGGKTRAGYGYFAPPSESASYDAGAAATSDAESIQGAGPGQTDDGFPADLEPVSSVDENTTKIPARVVENEGGTIKVRLHAEEFGEKAYRCKGINPGFHDQYPEGTLLYVKVNMFQMGKIFSVSFDGDFSR